ncbi:hypothetical protein C8Q80DRAFT_1195791 [Daedaleopsis nitida]|nr:hypothetical protein C8Q80DRAFT_1195791 [Daedaleopsis nitida]
MCWHIVTYREYSCGIRQCTDRSSLDCKRENCRLSKVHETRKTHDCPNDCKGDKTEEHHLIMDVTKNPCQICLGLGRTVHLGLPDYAASGIDYQHVG